MMSSCVGSHPNSTYLSLGRGHHQTSHLLTDLGSPGVLGGCPRWFEVGPSRCSHHREQCLGFWSSLSQEAIGNDGRTRTSEVPKRAGAPWFFPSGVSNGTWKKLGDSTGKNGGSSSELITELYKVCFPASHVWWPEAMKWIICSHEIDISRTKTKISDIVDSNVPINYN